MASVSPTSLLRCLALPHIAELSVNVRALQSPGIRVCTALGTCTETSPERLSPHPGHFLIRPATRLHATERQEFSLSRFKYHSLYSLGLRGAHGLSELII